MSTLIEKSKDSFNAAEYLYGEEKYCSSIHCAYYSCFQTIIHIVSNILNDSNLISDVGDNGLGSHNKMIGAITKDLISKDERKYRDFIKDIYDLKTLRTDADYSDAIMSEKDSRTAIQGLSTNINKLLYRVYNLN